MERKNFDDIINRNAVVSRWSRFIDEKTSTDLWTENDFLFFLDNEEIILNFTWDFNDGKYIIIKDENQRRKEIYKQKLDRLREIYNERFKETETDPVDHTKYTKPEKFYLLKKLGLTNIQTYEHLSETNKAKLLAKILDCNKDNAGKIKNGTDYRYTVNEISKQKIDKFLDKLINEK